MMHRALLLMALITSAVSRNDEEQCRDMFESFTRVMSQRPSPQYCRGVSHLNNVLKLTYPLAVNDSSNSFLSFYIFYRDELVKY